MGFEDVSGRLFSRFGSPFAPGFGTPVSTQVIMQLDEKDQVSPVSGAQIGVASTDELQSVLSTLQRFLESESKTVDVTPVVMPEGYPKA